MNIKRATALALSLSLLLGAAACGKSGSEAADTDSKTSAELLEEENAILGTHQELWDQVFASMDKSSPATAENYGDVLLSALENCKDKLSDEDYQTLKSDAESIRSIEEQIAALPADDSAGQSETAAASAFPEFTGKDLDGNAVDSSLFANNAYTVVNFWFSGCKPCVAELGELDKLNQTAKQQGGEVIGNSGGALLNMKGEVIGINTETLDGNADAIATAKDILQTKGATYRNIYFDSSSDAGTFALGIMAFPTTYVFDRNGNAVGEPLLGGIDNEDNMAALQKNIDAALAADQK